MGSDGHEGFDVEHGGIHPPNQLPGKQQEVLKLHRALTIAVETSAKFAISGRESRVNHISIIFSLVLVCTTVATVPMSLKNVAKTLRMAIIKAKQNVNHGSRVRRTESWA